MIPDELQVPGYDIEERIGKGGMASVYRARQHTFDRHVALKVLKPDLSDDESFCQRFVQESLIVAKLHHSNIVQVYDVGEFQNNFYIAMEYLNGGDLNSRLSSGVEIKDTIQIIKQAASALDFAHKKGIIHRDIKPDNIMFREDGAAVITDFGIAKELDSDMNLTQTGLIVGTPKYMSPEQIRGDTATAQADIYALGILLFQCLTNKVPFDGKDMVATAYKHFNEPVPTLPPLVVAFQPILEKMLAKKAEDRYERALDIVDDLDALSGEDKSSQKTNLDLTQEYDNPNSNLDPTVVHHYNQDTTETAAISDNDPTEHMTVVVENNAAPVGNETTHTEEKPTINPVRRMSVYAAAVIPILVAIVWTLFTENMKPTSDQQETVSSIQGRSTEKEIANQSISRSTPTAGTLSENERVTISRLLEEAQIDIDARRLKKPDANNAFNKLERVLSIQADNPQALAAMEQIAEEYAKLADRALENRQYRATKMFLSDAYSAYPDLNIINVIQTKLDAAQASDTQAKASIKSMEQSLMIDGLLRGAAIDEEEGRLRLPENDNALDKYLRILEMNKNHSFALQKVEELKP